MTIRQKFRTQTAWKLYYQSPDSADRLARPALVLRVSDGERDEAIEVGPADVETTPADRNRWAATGDGDEGQPPVFGDSPEDAAREWLAQRWDVEIEVSSPPLCMLSQAASPTAFRFPDDENHRRSEDDDKDTLIGEMRRVMRDVRREGVARIAQHEPAITTTQGRVLAARLLARLEKVYEELMSDAWVFEGERSAR